MSRNGEDIDAGFHDFAGRLSAVLQRDEQADGQFVYAVATTGIYCRPTCSSRKPLPANVAFFDSPNEAVEAGFRACKRCRPDAAINDDANAAAIANARRLIEESTFMPSLDELAAAASMSRFHFHRVFKRTTGMTPKQYTQLHAQQQLGKQADDERRNAGTSPIRFATGQATVGFVLVAASDVGVCAILLGDDPDELVQDLHRRFGAAELIANDTAFDNYVSRVIAFVDAPVPSPDLPLDIRGTVFQRRVWKALQSIPLGTTMSYADVAKMIDAPGSARAVAAACGANPLAVVIPCHRVVRSNGGLSGYRWGIDRKAALLATERAAGRVTNT